MAVQHALTTRLRPSAGARRTNLLACMLPLLFRVPCCGPPNDRHQRQWRIHNPNVLLKSDKLQTFKESKRVNAVRRHGHGCQPKTLLVLVSSTA